MALHPDIRRSSTLPPEAFRDPGFLARELETVFRTSWLLLPPREGAALRDDPRDLADLLRRRGARAPVSVLDRPLFLQRGFDGKLRAFPNVCTHAWHTLVPGPDRQRTVTCPQHGRQFDAAGRCLSQPGFQGCPGFPGKEDHLEAFPTAALGDLLFTALGRPELPFAKAFAPVLASLRNAPLSRMKRRPLPGEVREVDGNWKQHAWNYLDRFHIPFVHRAPGGLADAIDMNAYATEIHPHAVLQWAWARNPADGLDPRWLPARLRDRGGRRVFALWWFLFPDLTLNLYPWGLSVNVYSPVPGRPERTLFLWYHWVLDEAKYRAKDDRWLDRQVDDEDLDALGQVRRGIASGFARPGRFAPSEEAAAHWFHLKVGRAVA